MIVDVERGAQVVLQQLKFGATTRWQHEVMREVPDLRSVVRYAMYPGGSQEDKIRRVTVIAKYYADESGAHCFEGMSTINQALQSASDSVTRLLAVPEPIFYDASNRLLAQREIGGASYRELAQHEDYEHYLRLAGIALAELHGLCCVPGKPVTIADHIRDLLRPHPAILQEQVPEYASRVDALLECLEREFCATGSGLFLAPIHRDFHLGQLFYEDGRVWLIDWDYFAWGDPAVDVGNFIVYLRTKLQSRANPAVRAFLDGYQSVLSEDVLARVPLYQALTYLRLTCKRYRLQSANWRNETDAMLRGAEAALMEAGAL